ncbi:ribonuclease E/G [Marinicauda salina]|uniref:Ribonuclease E/G n=1 Tax=Marinicauda salina TaxID=2135793 RepID=A0A2U2BTV2_9PROT|nr:ribonuclease E/G [Marinicauda salina]PWE17419.1 ribonuclease E/G [Marinicauda salina]
MRIVVERSVGETRAAVIDGDRAVELHLERWSERGVRAVRGEVFRARVRRVEASLNGAFCDIGRGPDGFLPFGKARPEGVREGAAIGVQIAREAFQEKGPTLRLFEVEPGEAPETVVPAPPVEERLSMFYEAPVRTPDEADLDMEALFDAALEAEAPLPGGGRLVIEPVTALTAIDVDAAGRKAPSGGAKFAAEVNKAAAREAARQVRLRGIGGVVAIDFLPLKKKADQSALMDAVKGGFRNDPAKIDVAPPSRFAIVELSRQRLGRALHEICWERFGADSVETRALAALRALEREGRANRSARLRLSAGDEVFAWLDADAIGWRKAMTDRLGPRFELVAGEGYGPRAFEARPA